MGVPITGRRFLPLTDPRMRAALYYARKRRLARLAGDGEPPGGGAAWPDPTFANVTFLMAMDSDASPQDELSSNAYEMFVAGAVNVDATRQLFGNDSLLFPNSSFADIDSSETNDLFNLETGDFVIEGWVYNADIAADMTVACSYRSQSGAFYRHWLLRLNTDNILRMYIYKESVDTVIADINHQTALPANEFSHVAICRKGDDHFSFMNGVPSDTFVNSALRPTSEGATPLQFGNEQNDNNRFRGNLAEWRITQGECFVDKDTTYDVPTGIFPRS